MSKKNLNILKKKIRYCRELKEWCGYLTPIEILYIVENRLGEYTNKDSLTYLRECVKKGYMFPRWCYFTTFDREWLLS